MSDRVFVREATGLVRVFGVLDTVWINLSLVGIFFSLTFIASTATLTGGDPLLAGLIALVFMFLMALAFSITSIVAPRSASDYVFTSRYLSPALGFVGNAGYYVSTVPLFMGITITTLVSFGLGALFAYWGYYFGNSTFLSWAGSISTGAPEYAVGAVLTIIASLLPLYGYRVYRTLNRIILPLILLGVLVMFVVLASTPQSSALSSLNQLTGNSTFVAKVNSWGSANNSPVPSYTNFANTLALSAVFVVGFSYIISAIYFGGEVKNVKRNMPVAILATLLITLVIFAGSTLLSYQAFGYNFLSNLYTLSIGFASPPLAVVPYLDFLAAAISGNVVVGSFIIIVAIIQLMWYQTNAVAVGSRLLLSWSFDRIMPKLMADVSDRYHVPVKGMLISLAIGLIAGIFFVVPVTSSYAFLLSGAAIAIILLFPILMVAIALFNFRLRRREQFKASGIAGTYLGGILYYIAALGTAVYALFGVYEYLTVPAFFLDSALGYEVTFVPLIVLFLLYFVSREVNRRRGIQFDKIFAQIPPE